VTVPPNSSEHQAPLKALGIPLNLAPQGSAENMFLAGKLSSAEMEKADLKCLVEKSEHLLKIERSERARDTEEKAEMARKISELEGRLKEAVESLTNYKNEQPQKERYLQREAATEKQLERNGSEREREKEEVEGLLKVAEMEKAELVERVSKMEDLFQKSKEHLKIERSEREKERKGLVLEREKGKIELGEKLEDLKKQSEELELMAAQYDKMLRKAGHIYTYTCDIIYINTSARTHTHTHTHTHNDVNVCVCV
jgi:phenylpyruvate tautomerase PptA (4-oxalocrotonate tautomerase family)